MTTYQPRPHLSFRKLKPKRVFKMRLGQRMVRVNKAKPITFSEFLKDPLLCHLRLLFECNLNLRFLSISNRENKSL